MICRCKPVLIGKGLDKSAYKALRLKLPVVLSRTLWMGPGIANNL